MNGTKGSKGGNEYIPYMIGYKYSSTLNTHDTLQYTPHSPFFVSYCLYLILHMVSQMLMCSEIYSACT